MDEPRDVTAGARSGPSRKLVPLRHSTLKESTFKGQTFQTLRREESNGVRTSKIPHRRLQYQSQKPKVKCHPILSSAIRHETRVSTASPRSTTNALFAKQGPLNASLSYVFIHPRISPRQSIVSFTFPTFLQRTKFEYQTLSLVARSMR